MREGFCFAGNEKDVFFFFFFLFFFFLIVSRLVGRLPGGLHLWWRSPPGLKQGGRAHVREIFMEKGISFKIFLFNIVLIQK